MPRKFEFTLKDVNYKQCLEEMGILPSGIDIYNVGNGDIIETTKCITYLDKNDERIKIWPTMSSSGTGMLPDSTDIFCWWCRHPFVSSPIGCPVKYNGDKFFVEGIFCSFQCVKAYIQDTPLDKYKESNTLLSLLCRQIYGEHTAIRPAPSWKLLSIYGGHLSIEKFRECFNVLSFELLVSDKVPVLQAVQEQYKEIREI